jgi:hypothetical protein
MVRISNEKWASVLIKLARTGVDVKDRMNRISQDGQDIEMYLPKVNLDDEAIGCI